MYQVSIIHLQGDGYQVCFYILATMDKVGANMDEQAL